MRYISTSGKAAPAGFEEAVMAGLAPDGGLYLPEVIPSIAENLDTAEQSSLGEVAVHIAQPFVGDEIAREDLRTLVTDAANFPAPLVEIEPGIYCLELFHGPTLAFKDFGARFMARVMSHFLARRERTATILVATSGDTGSAVAQGFLGVPGTQVIILYPSGKVSRIQEQQLTTVGGNVTALEILGTFDDCQRLVKQAFLDTELAQPLGLSSANSINIARLVPQSFYYAAAALQLAPQGHQNPVFSVPSGNFGNLTGGIFAKRMGFPIATFVASTNANDVVPGYLQTGEFRPRASVQTISNAMDVGNPSNFSRLSALFDSSHAKFSEEVSGAAFTDAQTKEAIHEVYERTGYIMDPHGAVGYLGLQKFLQAGSIERPAVFLGTAHPAKFADIVEPIIGQTVPTPARLADCLEREKRSVVLPPEYSEFKSFLVALERN